MCAFTEMSRLFTQHQLAPVGSLQAYLFLSRLVGPCLSGLFCHGNSDVSEIRAGQFYLAQFFFCIIVFLTLLLILYTLGNGMRHVFLNIKNMGLTRVTNRYSCFFISWFYYIFTRCMIFTFMAQCL